MKQELEELNVDEIDENKRVDAYVAENTELSRTTVQRMIENEKILVNGKKTKVSYKIQNGDQISVEKEEAKEVSLKAQNIPVDILYEDNDIIVINKPKGMVVHPANGNPDGTLVNAVMAICKDSLSGIGGEIRPGIVHRLDKDTSGVIVVAKNDKAHINLSEQIKNHDVEKTYIAIVKGFVKENEATINMPIARSKQDRKKMAVDKDGKNAVTHFKVLKRFNNKTLIECLLETGRTHQIRVHLKYINHPIFNDPLYNKEFINGFGQFLHSKSIKFIHPITKKELYIECDIPNIMKEYINKDIK